MATGGRKRDAAAGGMAKREGGCVEVDEERGLVETMEAGSAR